MLMNAEPGKVLIIENDGKLSANLSKFLTAESLYPEVTTNGREAIQRVASEEFTAAIICAQLTDMRAFDLVRELSTRKDLVILIVSDNEDEVDRIVGLELGADDFVSISVSPREIAARLRAALRRIRINGMNEGEENIVQFGDLQLMRHSRQVSVNGRNVRVTSAEFAILDQLLSAAGEVVAKDDLAERALGRRLPPNDRSVDTHVSRLRRKLGPLPDGEPRIQSVRGRGYLIP